MIVHNPVNVFIVDDSAVVRQVLTSVLGSDPGIRVAGAASDPLFALDKMEGEWPDVIVLDMEMPRMDGMTFLKKVMHERPTPVVVCSTLTEKGADITLQALSAGAVDIITKPKLGLKDFLHESGQHMIRVVKAAADARPAAATAVVEEDVAAAAPTGTVIRDTTDQVVAMGTSTGGTQALEAVLTQLSETCPGCVVVQHMPERFTAAFAQRLDSVCRCNVREAQDGDRVIPGRVLIAPGGLHMQLRRSGARYHVSITDGPLVNRHKPSVDVLFRSVAKAAGRNAVGVIMTGMGDDGAQGMMEMRHQGAHTIAQNRQSCVVFGMPKEAIESGAAVQVLSLAQIASAIGGHQAGES